MCEFSYAFDGECRVRVIFDSLPEKDLTKCKIKVYINDELALRGLGIAFKMPEDEWSYCEGRKWAFIDAIRNVFPRKCEANWRKELQREYDKQEKKWEYESIEKLMDALKDLG